MDYILSVILAFGFSAVFTALVIPKIILLAFKKKLFDEVDERKVHTGIVPRLGGVAFVPAIVLSLAFMAGNHSLIVDLTAVNFNFDPRLALILCAFALLYFEGITDDVVGIGYKAKFVCQFACAAMVVGSGICLNDFHGLLGLHEVPMWFSYPFSVLLIVFIINAINLIDGIDGLSSGLSIIATFFMGYFFMLKEDYLFAILSFATLGTLASFFIYNVFGKAEHKNKIFMGDCGSQCIGLLLAMLGIRLSMGALPAEGVVAFPHSIVIAFSVLMIPCLDVIRVMGGRMMRHKNPFLPDKTHIHHLFLELGFGHKSAMASILIIDTFFVVLNLLLIQDVDVNVILLLDLAIWACMMLWLNKLVERRVAILKTV